GAKVLYNLSFENENYKDTTIDLENNMVRSNKLELRIENKSDKPIKIDSIKIGYYADELIFRCKADDKLQLEFSGNIKNLSPPYDMNSYRANILKQPVDRLPLGQLETIICHETKPPVDLKWVFNILVIACTIILGIIVIYKIKNN
ncbi:MAG: hypothetical protein ACRC37_00130, partial [Lentisphaeria bacterium]